MLRAQLTPTQLVELQEMRRERTLKPGERDRLEMMLLSAAGWSPPAIAAHLGCCSATVRRILRQFEAGGPQSLRHQPTGPPPDHARRQQVSEALAGLLSRPRTWTAAQLAAALGEQGIALSPRQVRRYLKLLKAGYRRTARTLRHKQDRARAERAARTLRALKKRPPQAS